jgi:hypothetical protein
LDWATRDGATEAAHQRGYFRADREFARLAILPIGEQPVCHHRHGDDNESLPNILVGSSCLRVMAPLQLL